MIAQVDFLYDILLDIKGMDISRVTNINDDEITFSVKEQNP
jgi:hypothetical protein